MNRQQSVYQGENPVVTGQSKVEKAKYVHTENNLRRTLENISETFKRTNKRLCDETETLRSDLQELRQSIAKIQEEKMRRNKGEYHKRRPYKAERFLYVDNIVSPRPFDETCTNHSKFATHGQNTRYKTVKTFKTQNTRSLTPIRLHQNKKNSTRHQEEISAHATMLEGKDIAQTVQFMLPKLEISLQTNKKPLSYTDQLKEPNLKRTSQNNELKNDVLHEKNTLCNDSCYLEVPRIPTFDLMDVHAFKTGNIINMKGKPHFLPPLDKIIETEVPELKSNSPADHDTSWFRNDKNYR